MNDKLIKVIGIGASVIGVGATLVSNWVSDKTLDSKISAEVAKALSEKAAKIES